ncbi:MAG: hypothetical protein ISR58_09550 [Anaerolineales bacterium]|nr:hypothetical protein [Chloroflexota bacterium]MBL6981421.1 hypothetical protein [Anaerolineales bacterium]
MNKDISKQIRATFLAKHGEYYFVLFITLLFSFGCALGLIFRGILVYFQDQNLDDLNPIAATDIARIEPDENEISIPTQVAEAATPAATQIPNEIIISSTNTPTSEPTPVLHGFGRVVSLPNDILRPPENGVDLENVIDSLAVAGFGGGGGGPCMNAPENGHWRIEHYSNVTWNGSRLDDFSSSIYVCLPESMESITADLVRPDGLITQITIEGNLIDTGSYLYRTTPCLDHDLYLQSGEYELKVVDPNLIPESHSFQIYSSDQRLLAIDSCSNRVFPGVPTKIFYRGFKPFEDAQVALYIDVDGVDGEYDLVNAWYAEMDEAGNLVQEIQSPKIYKEGLYFLAVIGKETQRYDGYDILGTGQPLEASEILWFTVNE